MYSKTFVKSLRISYKSKINLTNKFEGLHPPLNQTIPKRSLAYPAASV